MARGRSYNGRANRSPVASLTAAEDPGLRGNLKKHPTTTSIAEYYHEVTKYSPENLSATVPDPLQKPPPFKEYLSEQAVDLKPYLKGAPASGSGDPAVGAHGVLRSLSRLLYHTGGITDIHEGRGGTMYYRAAPSAGALYPTEIYLATSGIEGLSDGVHSYSVREHALVPIFEGDFRGELVEFCFRHPAAARARMFPRPHRGLRPQRLEVPGPGLPQDPPRCGPRAGQRGGVRPGGGAVRDGAGRLLRRRRQRPPLPRAGGGGRPGGGPAAPPLGPGGPPVRSSLSRRLPPERAALDPDREGSHDAPPRPLGRGAPAAGRPDSAERPAPADALPGHLLGGAPPGHPGGRGTRGLDHLVRPSGRRSGSAARPGRSRAPLSPGSGWPGSSAPPTSRPVPTSPTSRPRSPTASSSTPP